MNEPKTAAGQTYGSLAPMGKKKFGWAPLLSQPGALMGVS
jgi:hypothetical protein